MKLRHVAVLIAAVACSRAGRDDAAPTATRSDKLVRAREPIAGQYVVVLDASVPAARLAATAEELASAHGGTVLRTYGAALSGFAVALSERDAFALSADARVRFVEEDGRVRAAAGAGAGVATALGGPALPAATGVTLYVLDTGVRTDHVELAGRAAVVYPDSGVAPSAGDCNGHGTWVAAIAAGGSSGVAPGASVRAVNVLGCDGTGAVSSVLAGVEWIARNRAGPALALLAAAGGPSPSLDEGVRGAVAAGVPFVVAAGNGNADACDASPARSDATLAVGAIAPAPAGSPQPWTALDVTNGGPCVDVLAPGADVTSAWNTHATATHTMSGTSAAAARVAGAAAAFLARNPGATPARIAAAIAGTSILGTVSGLRPGTPDRVVSPEALSAATDDVPPSVAITVAAASGASAVTLAATATDAVGVTQVAFLVDGKFAAATATAPYAVSWDPAGAGNGTHVVTALAYDAAGNVGESAPVGLALANAGFANHDPALGAPSCATADPSCDSGVLLDGRGPLGPEPNAPNTIGAPCPDGGDGFYHMDESVDAIRIATLDGSPLQVGKGVEIQVKVWAFAEYDQDALDLYVAPDAAAPVWTHLATLRPADAGEQTLTVRHTLGAGSVQAVRAAFRYGGDPATCTTGAYDDRDDLVFAVADGTPDATPPSVRVVAPAADSTVGGAVALRAMASDASGVVGRVEFRVDDTLVGTATAPVAQLLGYQLFEVGWDASTLPDGSHQVTARAVDGAGNAADSAAVGFRIGDVVPPTVSITSPAANASVNGAVTIVANAQDDRAVTEVTFYADAQVVGTATSAPWQVGWTAPTTEGTVVLVATAKDAAGHLTTSAPVSVWVDVTAPTVEILSPAGGAIVFGLVPIVAAVDDDRGIENVAKVDFLANGVVIGTDVRSDPTGPSTIDWQTRTYPDGPYTLTAKAYDRAGNSATSAPVTVEVKDTTPPVITFVSPEAGSWNRGVIEVAATVTDDGVLAHVELFIDGSSRLSRPGDEPPFAFLVDTMSPRLADGEHAFSATASDRAGNVATREVKAWVDNTPPEVQLTAPAAAASVSGVYHLKATASDALKLDRVDFWVGPAVYQPDASEPFDVAWNTAAFDNGTYEVGAIAYDAAENAKTSAIVPVTVWNASTADWNSARKVPACLTPAPFCFSGTLLDSRGGIQPRAERNAPNTLDGCPDGPLGEYHVDESIDRVTVRTLDGTSLAPGKTASVEVTFFAVATEYDRVDLFYAGDANAPAWVPFATLTPTATGLQTLSATYVLPTGPLQAVRAATRYAEAGPAACAPGSYDDRDDLVFAVATAGADTAPPTVSITNPTDGGTVHGVVRVAASAADDRGVARVDFAVDGTVIATDAVPPYELEWDSATVADGTRRLTATAHDTSGNVATGNPVFVTVASAANAQYDAARLAPACAVRGSFCDSGTLVEGRDLLGPELHAPNTLRASCPDGDQGTYLKEESIERIVLRTDDGGALAPGEPVRAEVTVFASSAFDADALDLFAATTADAPAWRWIATLRPQRAGLQVLSTTYPLPPGALQAVRARFRYGGTAGACGTLTASGTLVRGLYDDHDDLAFAVPFVANASRDATLRVPRCTDGRFYCDSGTLLDGRAALGPEAHAPNTLRDACADGPAGAYHADPSIDAVRVYSAGAARLAAGARVVAEVDVWASDAWADEAVDVHVTDDPRSAAPTWTYVGTMSPTAAGRQTLATELDLGAGAVQAVRASYRSAAATPQECSAGATDDHDDLAFDVAP